MPVDPKIATYMRNRVNQINKMVLHEYRPSADATLDSDPNINQPFRSNTIKEPSRASLPNNSKNLLKDLLLMHSARRKDSFDTNTVTSGVAADALDSSKAIVVSSERGAKPRLQPR